MIARATRLRTETLQDRFLQMLPLIHEQASHAFRRELPERREELVAAVIANCWVEFVRLMDRGLGDAVYSTPLARYAVRQVRSGRKVGGSLNVNDVSSGYAQKSKGFVLESLDQYSERKNQWKEILVEDRKTGPAETAICRIDFGDWLRSLSKRQRRIAKALGNGEQTKEVAKRFGVSAGRISQVRRELMAAWDSFVGEDQEAAVAAPA
jgi:hypothetical protein